MGTRSRIGVMHGDVCKSVYCHWDGYLDHNGRILQEHYGSARANQLVALGDMSTLGPVLGQAHPFSKYDITDTDADCEAKLALMELAQSEGWCTFYGRDRGEPDADFKVDHTFVDFLARAEGCGAEYYYIMKDGVWYTGCPGEGDALVPLATVLAPVAKTWETVDL
jgi:hypothetical protein